MQSRSWAERRRDVVLAFWATVLLGVPFWYFTTRVSRATLPAIPTFDDVQPVIPLAFNGLPEDQAKNVVQGLNALQQLHRFVDDPANSQAYTVNWQNSQASQIEIRAGTRQLDVPAQQTSSPERTLISTILRILSDEAKRIASTKHPAEVSTDLRVVKYSPAYEVVFSLMNSDGQCPFKSWDIARALQRNVEPILAELSFISNFTLESQIQFHADLTFEPRHDTESGNHVLQTSDLKNFINSAEWNLATAQGESKPLNLLIFVPKSEHCPLVIQEDDKSVPSNSFILPQFGSIVIYNSAASDADRASIDDEQLDQLIGKSTQHLLTLLGLPNISPDLGDASLWRLDGLMRQRLVETILSAQETLNSIPKVVNQIPNMHVPGHVATLIQDALDSLMLSRRFMGRGDVRGALKHSRNAVRSAEQAFFDDKMVSLLYFPDEHKYGVYMPLFGPLLLPLLMAGLRELQALRNVKKKSK